MKTDKKKAAPHALANNGLTTQQQWRRLKRAHLREAQVALYRLCTGSVYIPRGDLAWIARKTLEELATHMSQQRWGK